MYMLYSIYDIDFSCSTYIVSIQLDNRLDSSLDRKNVLEKSKAKYKYRKMNNLSIHTLFNREKESNNV